MFLFLVILLWVAYYKDQTPLNTLKWWFWVDTTISVQESLSTSSEKEKAVDVTETIKETVEKEWWSNSDTSSTLSEADKEAARKLIDWLIAK